MNLKNLNWSKICSQVSACWWYSLRGFENNNSELLTFRSCKTPIYALLKDRGGGGGGQGWGNYWENVGKTRGLFSSIKIQGFLNKLLFFSLQIVLQKFLYFSLLMKSWQIACMYNECFDLIVVQSLNWKWKLWFPKRMSPPLAVPASSVKVKVFILLFFSLLNFQQLFISWAFFLSFFLSFFPLFISVFWSWTQSFFVFLSFYTFLLSF